MSETPAPLKSTLVKDVLQVTGIVYQANIALFVVYISFFVYLVIPRGARKHFCNAYPRRHSRTRYVKHEVPTLVTTHRMSYDSIDDVEQNNLQFQTPSARSSHNIGCTPVFPLRPAPMILNPEKAWIMTGEALMQGPKTPADGSMYSSPRGLFTSDRKRDRLGSTRTPLPTKIDENETMSPSSVVDQSMMSSSSSRRLLVLMSSRCLDRKQEIDQQEAFDLLRSRGVPFDRVDGMNSLHRKRREELYRISGTRAQYPQFFFVRDDNSIEYLGDWKRLQKIHHAEGLPRRFRDANPDVFTWTEVFGANVCDTSQYFTV